MRALAAIMEGAWRVRTEKLWELKAPWGGRDGGCAAGVARVADGGRYPTQLWAFPPLAVDIGRFGRDRGTGYPQPRTRICTRSGLPGGPHETNWCQMTPNSIPSAACIMHAYAL